MSIKVLALDCTSEPDAEQSPTEALLRQALSEFAKLGVEGELVQLATADLGQGTASVGWPVIRTKILGAQIFLLGTPAMDGKPSTLANVVLEELGVFPSQPDEHGHFPSYGKVAGVVFAGENPQESGAIVKALIDAGFTVAANAVVTRAEPDAAPVTLMARNVAHLAGLLRATSYPQQP